MNYIKNSKVSANKVVRKPKKLDERFISQLRRLFGCSLLYKNKNLITSLMNIVYRKKIKLKRLLHGMYIRKSQYRNIRSVDLFLKRIVKEKMGGTYKELYYLKPNRFRKMSG
jgi:hypothetical protein